MLFRMFWLMLWFLMVSGVAADGLRGKVFCGYQGWFRTPSDGTENGWYHYGKGRSFGVGKCAIEMWPDVRELPATARVPTEFKHADGSVAEVFSSINPAVVKLHFDWMKQYEIDGVFLQRFAVTVRDPRYRKPFDQIIEHCRKYAPETGRAWSLMYDLTGLKAGELMQVKTDWLQLQQAQQLTDQKANPQYLRHRGKPLVTLWGLGFSDRPSLLDEWRELMRFFRQDAGCSLMLGVPTFWRTLDRDAINDSKLHELIKLADVITPWTIGRYRVPDDVTHFAQKTVGLDIIWCQERGIDYLPVAFPGFSWKNLSQTRAQQARFDDIPRLGGKFLWQQARQFHAVGARQLYVAMFDELDEGTAIFKTRQDPPVGETPFLAEPTLPSDHYLWLLSLIQRQYEDPAIPFPVQIPAR
jgi:hypothetical protein